RWSDERAELAEASRPSTIRATPAPTSRMRRTGQQRHPARRGGANLRLHRRFDEPALDEARSSDQGDGRCPEWATPLASPGQLALLDEPALHHHVLTEVRRIARPVGSRVSVNSTLAEAGLDSLGRMELLAALECRLGVRLPEALGPELQTVGDLAKAVGQQIARAIPQVAHSPGLLRAVAQVPAEHYDVARFPEWT